MPGDEGDGGQALGPMYASVAEMWAESMDRSVDPCNDFYRYMCGNYAGNRSMGPISSQSCSLGSSE